MEGPNGWQSSRPKKSMKSAPTHPASILGRWLREKRSSQDMVAREFAERIWLTHAKYAEVELGVGAWIGTQQETLIPMALKLNDKDKAEFKNLLTAARIGVPIQQLSDVFTREELAPVRAYHQLGKQLTQADEASVLDIVFRPIA